MSQYIILILFWLFFALTHSIFAAQMVKQYFRDLMKAGFRYYRLCYSVLAAAIFTGLLIYNFSITQDLLWQTSVIQYAIAAVIGLPGLAVMLYCMRKYFFEMSGIDVFFPEKAKGSLQVQGLNKYIRHPLYLGTICFASGCFLLYPGLANLISFSCLTLYTLIGTVYEERRLSRLFGDAYTSYAAEVPMLFPRLFSKKSSGGI